MTEINYASFSRRLLASVFDVIIYLLALLVLALFFLLPMLLLGFLAAFSELTASIFAVLIWIFASSMLFVTHWLYYAGCEYSIHQSTPGKAFMGLKVTNYAGQRLSFRQASLRYLSRYLTGLTLGFGYLLSLLSSRRQTLYDIIAKTVVLHVPAKAPAKPNAAKFSGNSLVIGASS